MLLMAAGHILRHLRLHISATFACIIILYVLAIVVVMLNLSGPHPLGGGPRGVTKPLFLHSEEALASSAVHPTRGVNCQFKYLIPSCLNKLQCSATVN